MRLVLLLEFIIVLTAHWHLAFDHIFEFDEFTVVPIVLFLGFRTVSFESGLQRRWAQLRAEQQRRIVFIYNEQDNSMVTFDN